MINTDRANRVLNFVRGLRHTKAPWFGQSFNMQPWQESFLSELYGREREDGLRQYRQSLLFIPRKNGKTETAAALALYHLFADRCPGGEIYVAAGSRDQASLCFNVARDMVRQNPALKDKAKIIDSRKNITNTKNGSFFRAIAADANTAYGFNASAIIADELAFWKNRELWDALTTSSGTRTEPMVIAITTAGFDHHGVGKELYDYACKVRDGVIEDESFLPLIFEAEEGDAWDDPATWTKANPALNAFRNLDELEQLCRKAKQVPALESAFRRLYLNEWVSAETTWLSLDKWDLCAAPVDIEKLKGRPCFGGLDLSSTTDLSSFVLLFPDDEDPAGYDALVWNWLPEERVKNNSDRVPYDAWQREGFIETTPGEVIDYRHIKEKILSLSAEFNIKEIAFDRWNSSQLVTELLDEGANMIQTGMGYASMSGPTKWLEELILAGRIRHGGNPLLRWAASNVTIESDFAGNIKPSKAKSIQRIDPVVALILALSRAQYREAGSVYNDRQMLVL